MTWNCYLTIFKAESPVHIGYKQIGILKTTRYYITGKAMWGAITANLTRALFDNPNSNDYQAVGNFVKENIKTTYFFPAIKGDEKSLSDLTDVMVEVKNNKNEKFGVFLPRYEELKENNKYEREDNRDVGIKFSKLSKEEFEQIFVGSFVSTALDATTKTAEERGLHEFEFMKNKISVCNEFHDVYWIGYLIVKKDEENRIKIEECTDNDVIINGKKLSKVLDCINVGGELNYGCGKLKLEELKKEDGKLFGIAELNGEREEPVIKLEESKPAFSHVEVTDSVEFSGEIEPLVGREWSKSGAGMRISKGIVCFTPGTKIEGVRSYTLGEFGVWKICRA